MYNQSTHIQIVDQRYIDLHGKLTICYNYTHKMLCPPLEFDDL